jgi:hypothetical protein
MGTRVAVSVCLLLPLVAVRAEELVNRQRLPSDLTVPVVTDDPPANVAGCRTDRAGGCDRSPAVLFIAPATGRNSCC